MFDSSMVSHYKEAVFRFSKIFLILVIKNTKILKKWVNSCNLTNDERQHCPF